MIFSNKLSYGTTSQIFLRNRYISYVNFNRLKTNDGISEGSATGIDNSKGISIIKSYNEFLERYRLAFPNYLKNKKIMTFDIVGKNILKENYKDYGYGETKYGYNDTTGTASGVQTKMIIKKALTEVIEKNELLSFWYGEKGYYLNIDDNIQKKIDSYNYISDQIFIFFCNTISDAFTFFVILFHKKKLIASGISCEECSETALDNALGEAKILEWQTFNNPLSEIANISKEEHKRLFQFIYTKSIKYKTIFFSEQIVKMNMSSWVNDLNICVLSGDIDGQIISVKICSENLLCCLPKKETIEKYMTGKIIVKKYYNDSVPNCRLV